MNQTYTFKSQDAVLTGTQEGPDAHIRFQEAFVCLARLDLQTLIHEPEVQGRGCDMVVAAPPTHYLLVSSLGATSLEVLDVTTGAYQVRVWSQEQEWRIEELFFEGGEQALSLPPLTKPGRTLVILERQGL